MERIEDMAYKATVGAQTLKIDGADADWPADCFILKADHKECAEFMERMRAAGVTWPVRIHDGADDGAVPAIRWSGIYMKPGDERWEFVEQLIIREAAQKKQKEATVAS